MSGNEMRAEFYRAIRATMLAREQRGDTRNLSRNLPLPKMGA